jgi:flagellar protein FliT
MTMSHPSLKLYERMSQLSHEMALAAQANEWERLSELEREVSGLREMLRSQDRNDSQFAARVAEEDRRRKIDLIKKILADDREVRRHTEPWMDSVRAMLGGQVRSRAVRNAYNAVAE